MDASNKAENLNPNIQDRKSVSLEVFMSRQLIAADFDLGKTTEPLSVQWQWFFRESRDFRESRSCNCDVESHLLRT